MTGLLAHRMVVPEWLDALSPQDPKAVASRRDLQLLNFCMGHARAIRAAMTDLYVTGRPMRMAELGAGDGTFFLRLARALGPQKWGGEIFLIDRYPSVSLQTRAGLAEMGWTVKIETADVFDWLPRQTSLDVVVANLFLHHFEPDDLTALLRLVSKTSRSMIACEPRRCASALAAGSMLGFIGCNAVTRHDAPISVRAGFRACELSTIWPDPHWQVSEKRSGLFSHLFVARKDI